MKTEQLIKKVNNAFKSIQAKDYLLIERNIHRNKYLYFPNETSLTADILNTLLIEKVKEERRRNL